MVIVILGGDLDRGGGLEAWGRGRLFVWFGGGCEVTGTGRMRFYIKSLQEAER